MIFSDRKETGRFIRFAIVGTIGAVVDFGVFNLLIWLFSIDPVISNVVSFSVAVFSNFLLNRYWTYPDSRSKAISRQLLEFFVVNLIGVVIRTVLFIQLEIFWDGVFANWTFVLPRDFMAHNIALATGMVIVLFWNFFVNRYWTYADVKASR